METTKTAHWHRRGIGISAIAVQDQRSTNVRISVFGLVPFAEHFHVVNGQIVSVRGYYDPRSMLAAAGSVA